MVTLVTPLENTIMPTTYDKKGVTTTVTALPEELATVTKMGLYASFERCFLGAYLSKATQITTAERGVSISWELVDAKWMEKVRSILDRSVANPKDPKKLLAVVDLFYRAIAGWAVLGGFGGGFEGDEDGGKAIGHERYQTAPDGLTPGDLAEIRRIEHRVSSEAFKAKYRDLAVPRILWMCDWQFVVELEGQGCFEQGFVPKSYVELKE